MLKEKTKKVSSIYRVHLFKKNESGKYARPIKMVVKLNASFSSVQLLVGLKKFLKEDGDRLLVAKGMHSTDIIEAKFVGQMKSKLYNVPSETDQFLQLTEPEKRRLLNYIFD